MTATITLRVATPEDEQALSDLIAASYRTLTDGGYDGGTLAAALPLMSRANPKLLSSGSYYVAFADESIAGCGGWTFETPGTAETVHGVAHIRHFATHPAHLRKGVARVLIERCLADAHRAGATLMRSQSTLPAEAFYAAAGFVRVRRIEVAMGPGVTLPAIEMERRLP